MSGTREFTMEQSLSLSQYLGLNKIEIDYFINLIILSRAADHKLKKHIYEKLNEIKISSKKISTRIQHKRNLSETEKSVFYSTWIYSAIHLFTSLNPEGVEMEEILNYFKISRVKANEIFEFLVENNLCTKAKGRILIGAQSTFVPQGSPHLNWRVKSMARSDNLSDKELMYTAQISISKIDYEKIRDLAVEFIKRVNDIAKPSKAEELVNINLDLFEIN